PHHLHPFPTRRSSDLKRLAVVVAAGDHGELYLWDAEAGKELTRIRETRLLRAVAFASDGKTLDTGENDGAVRLRDAGSGKIHATDRKSTRLNSSHLGI